MFIARQPIFDREKNVYAYQLLYRSDEVNRAHIADESYATLKVIANSLLIGLQKLTSGKRAFIQFNRKLLLGKMPLLFPEDLLGVEVMDNVEPDERVIRSCQHIKKSGYDLIMNEVVLKDEFNPLIPMVDIIKIDFLETTPEERRALMEHPGTARFLAEKVETQEYFEEAKALGCVYFQGYFFRKPDLVSRKEVPGYKLNYLRILEKIHDPFPAFDEIEEVIKRDMSLTYKLLRFINSASYGFKVTVRSIHHALILLGKREVKKWLTIIVMSGIGRTKPIELMSTVVIRARFCELIAENFKLHPQPSDFFMMGIFSLVDAFLDRPKEEILAELPLEEDVKQALLGQEGPIRSSLQLVEAFEKAEWDTFTQLAETLNIDEQKAAKLYVEAVEWSKFLAKE
ncbi:MAG: HDOD domain-containing protein [bacterium]|nr:HDOD domain-containing protein [bacterium]